MKHVRGHTGNQWNERARTGSRIKGEAGNPSWLEPEFRFMLAQISFLYFAQLPRKFYKIFAKFLFFLSACFGLGEMKQASWEGSSRKGNGWRMIGGLAGVWNFATDR